MDSGPFWQRYMKRRMVDEVARKKWSKLELSTKSTMLRLCIIMRFISDTEWAGKTNIEAKGGEKVIKSQNRERRKAFQ